MPIVSPDPSAPNGKELRIRVGNRLKKLVTEQPALDTALALQEKLLGREIDLLEEIIESGLPSLSLPPRYLATKLKNGIPIFHGEPIPIPEQILQQGLRAFCDDLADGAASRNAALAISETLDTGQLQSKELLLTCLRRDQHRIKQLAMHHALAPDILWLLAELALTPFAYLLCLKTISSPPDYSQNIHDALNKWDLGFCPICASWPAIVEVTGDHFLRCSFCATSWQLSNYRCLYCNNDGENFITAAPDPEQPGRRLQMCGECGGYVKVLAVEIPSVFPLLAIDDLASMDLDLLAIERKYVRPVLPEIKKR